MHHQDLAGMTSKFGLSWNFVERPVDKHLQAAGPPMKLLSVMLAAGFAILNPPGKRTFSSFHPQHAALHYL
jgi:hypothetical protein